MSSVLVLGPGSSRRVLIVVQNMNYAFDRRVQNESKALVAAGIGVTVICPKGTTTEPDRHVVDGVVVRTYPNLGATAGVLSYLREFLLSWLKTARLTWRTHREEGFDLLQACNPPDTYWALGLLWKLRGKRFVYDQHDLCPELFVDRFGTRSRRNQVLHRTLLLLERATYRTAQHVLSPNESYRAVAMTRGGVPRSRTTVVMSTPDHRIFRRTVPHPDAHAGYRYLVVYVGVMGPQDGVDRLLRIARLRREAGRNDTRYVLLGFGDCCTQLQRMTTELGLDDCVHYTGRVDHQKLRGWLSAADLGITPDPSTPFTQRSTMNKTLEYMACEVAVVASDLVETRRSGGDAAVYARTEQQFADAIDLLLDDPNRRAEMGRIGRARVLGELSWDRFAIDYVTTMREVLGVGAPLVVEIPAQKRARRRSAVRAR